MIAELAFVCPLPAGLHARPASMLADAVRPFVAGVTLVNHRTGVSVDARSVLSIVGLDVQLGDKCLLRADGNDAEAALAAAPADRW
ncbi:MAG: HPr family phosphocarrier protein [Phycisphaerales bacterium]